MFHHCLLHPQTSLKGGKALNPYFLLLRRKRHTFSHGINVFANTEQNVPSLNKKLSTQSNIISLVVDTGLQHIFSTTLRLNFL